MFRDLNLGFDLPFPEVVRCLMPLYHPGFAIITHYFCSLLRSFRPSCYGTDAVRSEAGEKLSPSLSHKCHSWPEVLGPEKSPTTGAASDRWQAERWTLDTYLDGSRIGPSRAGAAVARWSREGVRRRHRKGRRRRREGSEVAISSDCQRKQKHTQSVISSSPSVSPKQRRQNTEEGKQ